jgi:hypothetical protein
MRALVLLLAIVSLIGSAVAQEKTGKGLQLRDLPAAVCPSTPSTRRNQRSNFGIHTSGDARQGLDTRIHQYPADSVAGRRPAERITHNAHAARAAGTASAIRERPAYQDVTETG